MGENKPGGTSESTEVNLGEKQRVSGNVNGESGKRYENGQRLKKIINTSMSLHFGKPNYECLKCKAIFLPYKKGIKCPSCGLEIDDRDTKEYLNTIDQIAGSMSLHKQLEGYYFPGAWITLNIMDHVQGIIFRIFDSMEEEKPKNKKKYLMDVLENKINWGKQEYLRDHIKDITLEVLKQYKDGRFWKLKKYVPSRWERIKDWFRAFLP